MDAINALRIARLALAMGYRIEPDLVDGKYSHTVYVPVGFTKQDVEAAEAYNKLAEMQEAREQTERDNAAVYAWLERNMQRDSQ